MSSIALNQVYRRLFESYPHLTLAVAGGALTGLGDVVAQLSQQIVCFTPYIFAQLPKHLFLRLHTKKIDEVGNFIMTFRAHFGFFALGQALVSTSHFSETQGS